MGHELSSRTPTWFPWESFWMAPSARFFRLKFQDSRIQESPGTLDSGSPPGLRL